MSQAQSKCKVCFTIEPSHFYKHHRSICKVHYCEALRKERNDPALREAQAYKARLRYQRRKEEALASRAQI